MASAPIAETLPPPHTSVQPRSAIASPSSAASASKPGSVGPDAQYTQTAHCVRCIAFGVHSRNVDQCRRAHLRPSRCRWRPRHKIRRCRLPGLPRRRTPSLHQVAAALDDPTVRRGAGRPRRRRQDAARAQRRGAPPRQPSTPSGVVGHRDRADRAVRRVQRPAVDATSPRSAGRPSCCAPRRESLTGDERRAAVRRRRRTPPRPAVGHAGLPVGVEPLGAADRHGPAGTELPDAVAALWADEPADPVDVEPLDARRRRHCWNRRSARRRMPRPSTRSFDRSQGNPLHLRHLVDGGDLDERPTLPALIDGYLAGLPAPVRTVLDYLAVAEPLQRSDLAALAGEDAVDAGRNRRRGRYPTTTDGVRGPSAVHRPRRRAALAPDAARALRTSLVEQLAARPVRPRRRPAAAARRWPSTATTPAPSPTS